MVREDRKMLPFYLDSWHERPGYLCLSLGLQDRVERCSLPESRRYLDPHVAIIPFDTIDDAIRISTTIRIMVWLSASSRKTLRRLGFAVTAAIMGCVIGTAVVLLLNHILLLVGVKEVWQRISFGC